ncbi:MAG: hypothetical protein ACK5RE_08575, partial [Pseudanabaena sp.]
CVRVVVHPSHSVVISETKDGVISFLDVVWKIYCQLPSNTFPSLTKIVATLKYIYSIYRAIESQEIF